ncbi:MAG: YqgE/AlgH family protein [Nocardioides sp.]
MRRAPDPRDGHAPRPGMLLVATPTLMDPNFAASVVLLLQSDTDGAVGVIVNRPSTLPVGGVLADWADHVVEPAVLFRGGPVATDGALGVGRLAHRGDEPLGFRPITSGLVGAGLGILDLDTPTDLIADAVSAVRIFAGYAGWDADQLRGEIAEGSWYLMPSEPEDAFRADPDGLHRDVLRRQPGELAWRVTRPRHPEQN